MLNGAAGHTYGANGIWQVNTRGAALRPFAARTHVGQHAVGRGRATARVRQLGLAKEFLCAMNGGGSNRIPSGWTRTGASRTMSGLYAAGIPRELRIVFVPPAWNSPKVKGLEAGVRYTAMFFDPASGAEHPVGEVKPDGNGDWPAPIQPTFADWVLILKKS